MESAGSAQIKSSELPLLVLSVAVRGLDDILCVCVQVNTVQVALWVRF